MSFIAATSHNTLRRNRIRDFFDNKQKRTPLNVTLRATGKQAGTRSRHFQNSTGKYSYGCLKMELAKSQ